MAPRHQVGLNPFADHRRHGLQGQQLVFRQIATGDQGRERRFGAVECAAALPPHCRSSRSGFWKLWRQLVGMAP